MKRSVIKLKFRTEIKLLVSALMNKYYGQLDTLAKANNIIDFFSLLSGIKPRTKTNAHYK